MNAGCGARLRVCRRATCLGLDTAQEWARSHGMSAIAQVTGMKPPGARRVRHGSTPDQQATKQKSTLKLGIVPGSSVVIERK